MTFDELTEEEKLILLKLKIKKKVETRLRNQVRIFLGIFAVVVMLFGTTVTPPTNIVGMIAIILFCLVGIPVLTALVLNIVIKRRTENEFQKYLEGEGLLERE